MTKETFLEVVSELVGYVEPYGDSTVDVGRYENQEKIISLVVNGVEDLINNSKYRNDYLISPSIAKIGDRAYEVLKEIHKIIGDSI